MRTSTTGHVLLAATAATLLLANGCMWAPELTDVKQDIARQIPRAEFRKDVTLSFGPLTMAFARLVTGFIPDSGEAREYLRDVRGVQVAVYDMYSASGVAGLDTPARLQELLEDGWEMAVRVHEDDRIVWLLYRVDDDAVREMFVVVLGNDELVLVKLKGRLEKLVARALEDAEGDWSAFPRPGA